MKKNMFTHKKGQGALDIGLLIFLIVGTVIAFNVLGNTSGDLTSAADNVSNSGLPLASLFSSNGVILLAFMGGLVISLVRVFIPKSTGSR